MTREELVNIINCVDPCWDGPLDWHKVCADRILAALTREREGEVVVCEGEITSKHRLGLGFDKLIGKRGSLIFRPAKGDR